MIVYVVRRRHRYTIDLFLDAYRSRLPFEMEVLSWERAFRARTLPVATYLFSDLERLHPGEQENAARIAKAVSSAPGGRILNDPLRSLGRYEMLRRLFEDGFNDFDVVRLTEARQPRRFPVFLRDENDHQGSLTDRIETPEDLEAAIAALEARGRTRHGRIAVEYCGEPDADGNFRKYAAFAVGGSIVARHIFWSPDWVVRSPEVLDPARIAEELRYVQENPHEAELRKIFDAARIGYGRIDYGIVAGRIQTWEINTNANTVGNDGLARGREEVHEAFAQRFIEALAQLDGPSGDRKVKIPPAGPWRRRLGQGALEHASTAIRWVGLSRYESEIRSALYRRHFIRRSRKR